MRVILAGDLLLGDQPLLLGMGIHSHCRHDFGEVFAPFTSWLQQTEADFLVANLECVLVDDVMAEDPAERAMKASTASLKPLLETEIPLVLSLANNHSMEYGVDAFKKTRQMLEGSKCLVFGLKDQPAVFLESPEGIVGVVGFSTVPAFYGCSPEYLFVDLNDGDSVGKLLEMIKHARTLCDGLLIYPHWGMEFMTEPSRQQRRLAELIVETGADLIVGAHSHVVQDSYAIQGVPVYFSIGNLVSDYPMEEMRRSLVVSSTWLNGGVNTAGQLFFLDGQFRLAPAHEGWRGFLPWPGAWMDHQQYVREGLKRRVDVRNRMLLHLAKRLRTVLTNRPLIRWIFRRALFLATHRRQMRKNPDVVYCGPIH